MLGEFRKKFIIISVLSVFAVIGFVVMPIYLIVNYNVNEHVDRTLLFIAENDGEIPSEVIEDSKYLGFIQDEEFRFGVRYFIVDLETGNVKSVDLSHIGSIEYEKAVEYTNKAILKKNDSDYVGNYKFLIYTQDKAKKIVFLNCSDELRFIELIKFISLLVSLTMLILLVIIISLVSNIVIQPFAENVKMQNRFITDAGHELKTPLAIISANADVLELTTGTNEWIDSIRNQTKRLDNLVKDLLLFTKMGENKLKKQDIAEFNVSRCVQENTTPFVSLAQSKNLVIRQEISPDLLMTGIESDIASLVSILLDNAIKYADGKTEIVVSLKYNKNIALCVSNRCGSVKPEEIHKFFGRFYRADVARTQKKGGYGIGLSIAEMIVKANKGTIKAELNGDVLSFIAVF